MPRIRPFALLFLASLLLHLSIWPLAHAEIVHGCYIPTIFDRLRTHKVDPDLKHSVAKEPSPIPECTLNWKALVDSFKCWRDKCPKWSGERDWETGAEVGLAERAARILSQQVFGQDNAVELLAAAIRSKRSDRPLSIHIVGDNGTGKTLSATLLAKALFQGSSSHGLLYIRGNSYLSKSSSEINTYRKQLRHLVETQLERCPASLIVVDELQSLHRNTIVAFDNFLDATYYSDHIETGGADPRQATFVFVSDFGKEGTSSNDTPEQVVARAYDESSSTWQSGRTAALIQHIIPLMPVTELGAFELTSYLTKQLFTHSYWKTSRLNLTGINFCPADQMTRGLSKYIWRTMTTGISKLEQYRGIQKVFEEEVVQKALTAAAQFQASNKLWRIDKDKPAPELTLNICTNGGANPPTLSLELPWCSDIEARKKAQQHDEL